jgi:RNA polymerase sigma-70 factor (ECF subfamily)
MRHERAEHTLQDTAPLTETVTPPALVHEAYLKLAQHESVYWQNRAHFFGIAARLMRHILVDHARGHGAVKPGAGKQVVSLKETLVFSPEKAVEVLKIDESPERLAKLDPRQGRIVELCFFGGLTVEETAEVLRISPKRVKREWSVAKAWLHGDLRQNYARRTGTLAND